MEKGDTRLSQHNAGINKYRRNIVELESHREIRNTVNELIQLTTTSTLTTYDLQLRLQSEHARSGRRFSSHLVRALQQQRDQARRQATIWLLTLLNDQECIPQLQQITSEMRLSRATRLAAALALAGMGASSETRRPAPRYAIS